MIHRPLGWASRSVVESNFLTGLLVWLVRIQSPFYWVAKLFGFESLFLADWWLFLCIFTKYFPIILKLTKWNRSVFIIDKFFIIVIDEIWSSDFRIFLFVRTHTEHNWVLPSAYKFELTIPLWIGIEERMCNISLSYFQLLWKGHGWDLK